MSTQVTKAKTGATTKLQMGDAATPEVFTEIADLTSVKHTGGKLDLPEATQFESPNNTKEYITSFKDTDELTIEGNYTNDATQAPLETAFDAGTQHNFKLIIPLATPKTWSFAAAITAYTHDMSPTGIMKFTATLKALGSVTKA